MRTCGTWREPFWREKTRSEERRVVRGKSLTKTTIMKQVIEEKKVFRSEIMTQK